MCGIWGFVGREDRIKLDGAWDGLCTLAHRGPDAWGFYTDTDGIVETEPTETDCERSVFLGNRRLSVIDPSVTANQPMCRDGTVLVYNGEIYNYQSLRDRLATLGYSFESDSDTEVVLAAYREFGRDCVEHLEGMFAFAAYDETADTVFLARDRLGIKPLYFTETGDGVAFASEVTSLLDGGVVPRRVDETAVADYLRLGYVPEPRTIVRGVESLPAGATLTYDRTTGAVDVQSYWSPEFTDDESASPDRIRELLTESTEKRLVSDVPLGAFLSGGLDSSSLVALMSQSLGAGESVHTCSVVFDEDRYTEAEYASAVTASHDTDHQEREVGASEVRSELPDILTAMDQPSVDAINTYFVSQTAARQDLTVALSGLGADELLFGYSTFDQVRWLYPLATLTDRLPDTVTRLLGTVASKVGSAVDRVPGDAVGEVLRPSAPFGSAYLAVRGMFSSTDRDALLGGRPGERTPLAERIDRDVSESLRSGGVDAATSHAEIAWYMRNQLLRDTDSMSMAHSLEVRVPFLDTDLVEYVTSIPGREKRAGEPKALLKTGMADLLPDETLQREKEGFVFPLAEWLEDEFTPVLDRVLTDETIEQTPLDPESVQRVRDEFEAGDRHWSRLWLLVVLVMWIDEHIHTEGGPRESSIVTPRRQTQ